MKNIGKEFLMLREIDSGNTSTVYLVKSMKTEKIYAAKVYGENSESFFNEVDILEQLSSLNSPNIIHLISYGEDYIINNGIPEKETKQYIILEYMPNNDLFYYATHLNEINEQNIKKIFYKILKAVQQCHDKGICHRDLKLENIMFNEQNEPVLCDFGYGGLLNENEKFTDFVGTLNYMAPEILKKIPYSGIRSDIFSLGVILFALIIQKFGFKEATQFDELYRLIIQKKYEEYWEKIGNIIGNEIIEKVSPEFKELYLKMVAYSPNERPSIEDIIKCEWLKNI
jgi:serine/threonine protein kinase